MYRPGRADEGAALARNSAELAGVAGLADGTWDAEVCAELGCGPADLVVDKVRFDVVLSSYELAEMASVSRGFGAGHPRGTLVS